METKNKIESMVELRAFALEMAVNLTEQSNIDDTLHEFTLERAKSFEDYIKGDAQLPEIKEENDKMLYEYLIKMWEENNKIEKQRLDNIFSDHAKENKTKPFNCDDVVG